MTTLLLITLVSTCAGILLILPDLKRPSPKCEHQWAERIRKTH